MKMKKMMVAFAGAVLGTALSANVAKADCGEVSIGAMGWASGESITALAAFVLEQGYG